MFDTKQEVKSAIAIIIRFRKAFDAVEWDYIKAALQILISAQISKIGLILFIVKPQAGLSIMDTHRIFFLLEKALDKAVKNKAHFS